MTVSWQPGRLNPADEAIGDFLVQRRFITLRQLDEAAKAAIEWKMSLSDVLMAKNWLRPIVFYRALAEQFDLPFVDLSKEPPDPELLDPAMTETYAAQATLPIRRVNGRVVVATARPGVESLLFARRQFGATVDLVVTSKFDILWALQHAFREEQSHQAVYALAETDPLMSAQTVATRGQLAVMAALGFGFVLGLVLAPVATLIAVQALIALFYTGNFIFKAILVWAGGRGQAGGAKALEAEARLLSEADLPVYTILVPMFREPEVLPILAGALRDLDYPLAKLDIKIVLEEGDEPTIEAAKRLGLEGIFEIIRVPPSQPQTKPKACNYALPYARGDYLVIYDAEDKPERDQLRKVVAAFRRSPKNIACIQCRLNYYNAGENWLTRLFTLDYSLWFDLMLPGLERLGVPIPLGGTSNHFKIDVLRELHAWDPFNVTEDADLGIRMTQKGYRVGVIDSTTYEEANVSQSNWVRQRSRWIKGYMQTFLVHTRRPLHLMRSVGPLGVIGFVFFIGGTAVSGLLNPIVWASFLFWLLGRGLGVSMNLPEPVLLLALFNLIAGNGLFIWLMSVAPIRRNKFELSPFALTAIWYWVLMSVAAWKGLWQLVRNPFYWEKTSHGLSKHTAAEVASALAAEPTSSSFSSGPALNSGPAPSSAPAVGVFAQAADAFPPGRAAA
ncbi:glycosyltransferase [Phenylobacterium sp. LjRoot225]|uniref:glycosyltransferase family 2 protein n=1 Tax=Phenylobacterium sp. LjRoot225 TaxID=3342285 RepID=UPI003ECFBBAB